MDDPGLLSSPLVLALVAAAAFWLGRVTKGESAEIRADRRMREARAADEAFSSIDPSKQAAIDRLLIDGKIIAAVKLIREATGLGLKDAKAVADRRRAQLNG